MPTPPATLMLTLHWRNPNGPQSTTAICEDSPPRQLLPVLLKGCGLPPEAPGYVLRLGAIDGRLLASDTPLSWSGVRSGSHLWLQVAQPITRIRCLLTLPGGGEILISPQGANLKRAWLLSHLALLDPQAHTHELAQFAQRTSAYRWVSRQTHCQLTFRAQRWSVTSQRAEAPTLLSGTILTPGQAEPLRDGDRLTLGEEGPTLGLNLMISQEL